MTNLFGGRCALLLAALAASPAMAEYQAQQPISVTAPGIEAPAPAGLMGDHVHRAGEFMLGLRVSRDWSSGPMRAGTTRLSDVQVAAHGYSTGVREMVMDMAMLDIMWAPHDRVTLMVMPMWMRMDMEMVGLGDEDHGGGHDHGHGDGHAMAPGETMRHEASGFGDTMVSAIFAVKRSVPLNINFALGMSIPTGTVGLKNADGTFQHYMMQPGSGTWDLVPALTISGRAGPWGWGAQAGAVMRMSDRNTSGYSLGDRFTATAWGTRQLADFASLSARVGYVEEGAIRGHYNGLHHHHSPSDIQGNYGGRRLDLGVGLNLQATGGPLARTRLSVEWLKPVYHHVNGIQLPQTDSLQLALLRTF